MLHFCRVPDRYLLRTKLKTLSVDSFAGLHSLHSKLWRITFVFNYTDLTYVVGRITFNTNLTDVAVTYHICLTVVLISLMLPDVNNQLS